MNRRAFNTFQLSIVTLVGVSLMSRAMALSLDDLGEVDATKGLKAALDKGAASAIALLGAKDGFLGNEKVRIPLPGYFEQAAGVMRTFGLGDRIDELVTAMNRGAEAAVPKARDLMVKAVNTMTVQDAKGILSGGDTAVTTYFESKTRADLTTQFLPIVTTATSKVGLADKYNQLAGKASGMGLVKPEDANIERYVTTKALDGLFFTIGEEEKKIRQNPVAYGSSILTKVFGSLRIPN